MKAPKLDGVFNIEVNIYPCNLKGRKIAKGKKSEKKTSLAAMEKNLNELVLNTTWVNNENYYSFIEIHTLSILLKGTSINFVISHCVIYFDLKLQKAVPYKQR